MHWPPGAPSLHSPTPAWLSTEVRSARGCRSDADFSHGLIHAFASGWASRYPASVARSRVSYVEAVRLLTGGTDAVAITGRVAGGLLLAAAPFAPDAVLSLFDAKGEANNLLREMVGAAPARIRSTRGRRHYELLEAAHGVLVLSAFFDAIAEVHGPRFAALEITDEEKHHIGKASALRAFLLSEVAPMPGATRGFAENLVAVEGALRRMSTSFGNFIENLAAGRGIPAPNDTEIRRAVDIYRERYVRLATDVPEFRIWGDLDEHAATRMEIRKQEETLVHLHEMLSCILHAPTPATEAEQRLANHAIEVLRQPIWRAETANISFPTVEQGFISPRFRIARADKDSRLADETWWQLQDEHENLTTFLTAYLTDPASTELPLVILGSPGAGKSLLTKVLAARLPAEVFTTFRVPLRSVDPDADIYHQVEKATEQLIHERLSWADQCRASDTTKIVLLDGFDELVQATGITQSNYLSRAARFQQEEWINGRSVVVVVTSRTLVMDRTVVPEGTLVIKLDPFNAEQVEQWTEIWNTANLHHSSARPLTPDELGHHAELAEQPLLLLMLAIYAASGEARLDAEELSTEDLYGRLLDSFIRRQIRHKEQGDLDEEVFAAREIESRRDLATVAFAMFNRGQQWVSENDLGADLRALDQGGVLSEMVSSRSVTRAQSTITSFFFVHTAQTSDEAHAPERRTYEFMHATFSEYLIAEQTSGLLRDLADDWARSQGRAYASALEDRILRALLSHQPLTSRQQIVPFLQTLSNRMPMHERDDLRHALLDLYGRSRRHVPDDPYRPTRFDAVNRLAAYTANLVLLATLCASPEGLAVEELCGPPGAPSLDSTVKLWRSGLDAEAQRSLFDRLIRVDDRLRTTTPYPLRVSLQVAEARITGDRQTETVLTTGERLLPRITGGSDPQNITAFQQKLHQSVVGILASRWPTPQLKRAMPYDEQLYVRLAELAEDVDELATVDTARLLAQLLVYDDKYLPGTLVGRLIETVFRPELIHEVQPMLSVLALGRPELFNQYPELIAGALDADTGAFLFEIALASGEGAPSEVRELAIQLGERLESGGSGIHIDVDALPSMVRNLRFSAHRLAEVIEALDRYRPIAWSQVRPMDLLAAINVIDYSDESIVNGILHYVADRDGDDFGVEDAAAFEEIRRHCNAVLVAQGHP
ncbi:NACHT domain-containing protein [Micromonospora sp. NPDC050784]|uniref:NACHT domain-containing protein n=1 Tax=Micromonospora sp. NPDC050784 TaxID=3364281 RepID=UPI0037B661D5